MNTQREREWQERVTSGLNSENEFDKQFLSPFYISDTVMETYRLRDYEREMYAELYNTAQHALPYEPAFWDTEECFR